MRSPDADAASACEAVVRAKLDAGDVSAAATEAIRTIGPEVLRFMITLHRDEDDATDAFSGFGEQLWRALPGFRWECSLRSLCWRLARNASVDFHRAKGVVARRRAALSDCPEVEAMAAEVRSATRSYLRTDVKNELEELRRTLSHDDQTLLVLRLEQRLAWSDLARVMLDGADPGEADVKREAARLRKRFQLVKEQLVALGEKRGLVVRRG
jgi:RNA polymerase sigma-70 factor (ECF subfamily)